MTLTGYLRVGIRSPMTVTLLCQSQLSAVGNEKPRGALLR
jgi:hypothetical protein